MNITYTLVLSPKEKEEAAALVRKEYRKKGYASENATLAEKIDPFLQAKTSQTFLARDTTHDTPLATVSVIMDSPLGLPLDELYRDEINPLRQKNKQLAEISQLSLDSDAVERLFGKKMTKKNFVILPLFKLVLYTCLTQNVDTLCIAINPKHEVFYDALGFQTIGDLKYYSSFNQAPAIAKVLDLKTIATLETKNRFLYQAIVLSPPDAKILAGTAVLHIAL